MILWLIFGFSRFVLAQFCFSLLVSILLIELALCYLGVLCSFFTETLSDPVSCMGQGFLVDVLLTFLICPLCVDFRVFHLCVHCLFLRFHLSFVVSCFTLFGFAPI